MRGVLHLHELGVMPVCCCAENVGLMTLEATLGRVDGGHSVLSVTLMCRYWDNPKVLEKLSGAMGDAFNPDAAEAGVHGEEEGEEGEEEPAENSVHGAASSGIAIIPFRCQEPPTTVYVYLQPVSPGCKCTEHQRCQDPFCHHMGLECAVWRR